jgi:hypothetical protein
MENQELFDSCKFFLGSSLFLLNEKVNGGGKIPEIKQEIYSIVINENSKTCNLKCEIVPDFGKLIDNYQNDIEKLPQFINCKKLLVKVNINKDNHETIYLFSFLKYYLQKNQSLNFNIEIFNKIYPGVEDFIFHNKINVKHVFPLKNFKSDIDEISLTNNIKIKKITEKDFDEMFKETKKSSCLFSDEVLHVDYQLEMVESIVNGAAINDSNFGIICYTIISALRLFKTGIIGNIKLLRHCSKYKYESWEPIWQPVGGSISMVQSIYAHPYNLISQDVGNFTELWEKYNNYDFNENRPVDIAIRRFNYAYEKEQLEDKLIDYMIALEALFLKEDENTELKYRLTLRTALFIGSQKEEINQIREVINKAYDIRSKIVHGSGIIKPKELMGIQELTPTIEEYIRLSLKKFLYLNENPEKLIKKIENNLCIYQESIL